MSAIHFLRGLSSLRPSRAKRMTLAAASCVMLGLSMTACASTPSYNPDHLPAASFERVSEICQTVMGLNPNEPLTRGYWLGQPRIDYDTSHYRVCVLSLSDSLQAAVDGQRTREADAACRGKGLAPGSSDLALCVLQRVNDGPTPDEATQVAAAPSSHGKLPRASTSYYRASPHDDVHREQLACAALGIDPSQSAFTVCVRSIDQALYAIENPIT